MRKNHRDPDKLRAALRQNLKERKGQARKIAANSDADDAPALKLRSRRLSPRAEPSKKTVSE